MTAAMVATVMLPIVSSAAETSGPAEGVSLMLDIKPFNQDGEKRCAVCSTAPHPLIMTFVTHNDEATHKLLAALDEAYKAHRDDHLAAVMVLPGQGDELDALQAWIREQHFATPAATVALDDEDLGAWKLNAKVANTVVFLKEHKVKRVAVDLLPEGVADSLKSICP